MSGIPEREEALFAEALEQPPEKRGAFLARACGPDVDLLARVATLLAAHDFPDRILATAPAPLFGPEEKAGDRIARYKLLQRIGEGGCGVVWMAEQEEPVRRRVALKVIKLGMDTKAVVTRFEAERQALALMDHPNIAKVHDAGSTDTGRPFFVMELVCGVSITKYCDDNRLTPRERLELFIKVCRAVQHAHQKGVIHRDLKPSNILVTLSDGIPTPKIIDFGIAKATQGRLTAAPLFTACEQLIGTPVYMSPEQADLTSMDIDTRTDIYSLGLVLYELLTGRLPFDATEFFRAGVDAIRHHIREDEAPRPSRRWSTLAESERARLAQLRGTSPGRLADILRGDLDWIVMRCIEKDRTHRYDTANGLASEIERYLRNMPVTARPPSTRYRLRKLILRHRLGFTAGVGIVGALSIGTVVATWHAMRATRAELAQSHLRLVAEQARANETAERVRAESQRQRAEAGELAALRRAYAGDMRWAQQALEIDFQTEARDVLDRYRPTAGQLDLRGWEWRYLWQFCRSEGKPIARIVLKPLNSIFTSLAVSADGRWLAATRRTHADIKIWDARTGQPLALSFDEKLQPALVAFAPHAPLLAVVAEEVPRSSPPRDRVALWNLDTGQLERQWTLDSGCVRVLFSPDGRELLTILGGEQNQFTVWQVSDGGRIRQATLPVRIDHVAYVENSALAIDAQWRFAAMARPEGLAVIDLGTRSILWRTTGPLHAATAAEFSPDGSILAVAEGVEATTIKLWDMSSRREIAAMSGHHGKVRTLLFRPDGTMLASGCTAQTVRLWNVGSRGLVRTIHLGQPGMRQIVYSPDGDSLLATTAEGVLQVDISEDPPPNPHVRLQGPFVSWCTGMDGRSVVTVDREGNLVRWRGREWREREAIMNVGALIDDPGWFLRAPVRFARDRPLLAKRGAKGSVEVWDWEQRKRVHTLATRAANAVPELFFDRGRRLLVRCFHAADPTQRGLYEWDMDGGFEVGKWPVEYGQARAISASPDERICLLGEAHGMSSILIDRATGAQRPGPVSEMPGRPAALSPNGRLCATAHFRYVNVVETGQFLPVAQLTGYLQSPRSPVFSPDGQRLAVDTGKITLWDVEGWQRVLTVTPAASISSWVDFSPDGNLLGHLSNFGVLDLWYAPSWAEIEAAEEAAAAAEPRR